MSDWRLDVDLTLTEDRQAVSYPKYGYQCDCRSHHKQTTFRKTQVNTEGICLKCGHYAVLAPYDKLGRRIEVGATRRRPKVKYKPRTKPTIRKKGLKYGKVSI